MLKKYLLQLPGSLFLLLIFFSSNGVCQVSRQKLFFTKPAKVWEECLPLGNGRLGMMPDGGIINENITLNDITMWSGSPQDANNYNAYKRLPEIRRLLAEGKNDEAQAIVNEDFICKGKGSGSGDGADVPFGCYQILVNLHLAFNYGIDSSRLTLKNYKRSLSLDNAIANCSYTVNGVTYNREYITSFGDDVDVIRITASKPGQLNFSIGIDRPQHFSTKTTANHLEISGQLPDGNGGGGMKYFGRVDVKIKGGQLLSDRRSLQVKNATEAIVYVSAKTDFKDAAYKTHAASLVKAAMAKAYPVERSAHIRNFQKLFNRVSINLGTDKAGELPTIDRLRNYQQNPDADPGLPALFYQYGRYLSICSTRVGLLPPNLQGLWANQVQTPWNGDYHLDVNVQMNHWPLEASNLSELNLPLAKLVEGMVPYGEKTAKAYYNARGWVAHVITNIWGFTEPGESASWGVTKVGSAWLCNNLWQHFDFTGNMEYLREIYPVLKGAALFYNDMLVPNKETGWLVTSPSSSPENTFYLPDGKTASICEGPTIDNQAIRELFENVITAGNILHTDKALCDSLQQKIKRLPPVGQISKDGRLMEWLKDYKETDIHHRHISHLYALYPGNLITTNGTPDLAEACKKTLEARGDDGPSWSIVYKQLFWARLHDGNHAYLLLKHLLRLTERTDINYGAGGGIYANLFSAGPPFQIDGNFGGTAAIAEMLLQSHAGYVELLPAIPDAWKASGQVKGLKARGNITVNFSWKNGRVTSYQLLSPNKQLVKLKVNGVMANVQAIKA
jgi:alpha-L-fucosidase 2